LPDNPKYELFANFNNFAVNAGSFRIARSNSALAASPESIKSLILMTASGREKIERTSVTIEHGSIGASVYKNCYSFEWV
jgi:hypothetical protein